MVTCEVHCKGYSCCAALHLNLILDLDLHASDFIGKAQFEKVYRASSLVWLACVGVCMCVFFFNVHSKTPFPTGTTLHCDFTVTATATM